MALARILHIPTQAHTELVFKRDVFERFTRVFDVTLNEAGSEYTTGEVAEGVRGFEGLVTGWGSPVLTERVFLNADRLRIIAHTAGSIKWILPEDVVEGYVIPRRISVVNANKAIAYNVAEAAIGYLIMACRRFMDHALAIRGRGVWRDPSLPVNGQFLSGSTVGVVSASKVGREVVRLLKPFDVRILVYDPYLQDWEAGMLGVEKTGLDSLFSRSEFVTVHTPLTRETVSLIGRRELSLLRDGAVFVNTSRGRVVDQEALLEELRKGRFTAVLDVTDPEPLPAESPLRTLPNVIITPHISGAGYYGYFRIGSSILQALIDFFTGGIPEGLVNLRDYSRIA